APKLFLSPVVREVFAFYHPLRQRGSDQHPRRPLPPLLTARSPSPGEKMRDKRTQAPATGVAAVRVFRHVAVESGRQKLANDEDASSPLRKKRSLPGGMLLSLLVVASLVISGCAGLVTGQTAGPSTIVLSISNVQTSSTTTSGSQIIWTTNVPADSSV